MRYGQESGYLGKEGRKQGELWQAAALTQEVVGGGGRLGMGGKVGRAEQGAGTWCWGAYEQMHNGFKQGKF